MVVRQKLKKLLIALTIGILALWFGIIAATGIIHYQYAAVKKIAITHFDGQIFAVDIPVKFVTGNFRNGYRGFPLDSKDRKNYVVRWNSDNDDLYIAITRWELGGLYVMSASYAIKDEKVKLQVLRFIKSRVASDSINLK